MLSPAMTQMSPLLSGKSPADCSVANDATANKPIASTTKGRMCRMVNTPRASVVAENRVGLVRFFERLDLRGVEFEIERGEGVVEVVRLRRADDRGGHAGFVQEPCQCHLGVRNAAFFRDLADAVHDREIAVGVVHLVGEIVGLRTAGLAVILLTAVAGQEAAGERAPRDQTDPLVEAERVHLPLLLAVNK